MTIASPYLQIGLLTNGPSPHLFPLPRAWADLGHTVRIVFECDWMRFGTLEELDTEGMSVETIHAQEHPLSTMRTSMLGYRKIRQLVSRSNIVVLSGSNRSVWFIVAWLLTRVSGTPAVMMAERPDHRTSGWRVQMRNAWLRVLCRRLERVWPMSEVGRTQYERAGATVNCIIPYPAPEHLHSADLESKWTSEGPYRVLVVGSLIDRKQPLVAAQVARCLAQCAENIQVSFLGDGPLSEALSRAVDGTATELVGAVAREEVLLRMLDAHVLLHCSVDDGWGMVVAEAVAAGMCVVSGPHTDAAVEISTFNKYVRIVPNSIPEYACSVYSVLRDALDSRGQGPTSAAQYVAHEFGSVNLAQRSLVDLASVVVP